MIKLLNLILEDINIFNKKNIGRKFVGSIDEIAINQELNEQIQNNKIEVNSKKTGKTYLVSKNWYQKHKNLYTLHRKNIKLKKSDDQQVGKKFSGLKGQIQKYIEQPEPKNAQQFIEKYTTDIKKNYKQAIKQIKSNTERIRTLAYQSVQYVRNYTMHGYIDINKAIRNNFKYIDSEDEKQIKEKIQHIRNALNVCQSYGGVCYRLIPHTSRDSQKYFTLDINPGDTFSCKAFSSTSYDITKKNIQFLKKRFLKSSGGYQLFIKSKNGKIIEGVSVYGYLQKQVLFDIDSKFKVIDVVKEEDSKTTAKIYLVQV